MIAIAVATALVFDLLCSGSQGRETRDQTSELSEALVARNHLDDIKQIVRAEPFSRRIRVDLGRGRWCFDRDCTITVEIMQVRADELLLDSGCGTVAKVFTCAVFRVDRETGRFHYRYFASDQGAVDAVGTCVTRPSKGLPRPEF